jgi:CHAT domain-containing protein
VARLLGVEPLLGAAASETALKEALPRARYLHLAVHGFVHAQRPELSCLALARGGGEDGILEVRELGATAADLVVLSACDSGGGELAAAEGILGFGRAFFIAGARHLIVSAWPVSDQSAAELMPAFWKSFLRSRDPAAALRDAQRTFLARARSGGIAVAGDTSRGKLKKVAKDVKPDHPFFWAGFVALSTEVEPCGG